MSKIKGKSFIEWKYVRTKENPSDFGSRGCEVCKLDNKWWEGPKWPQGQTQWPEQPKTENCEESDIEKKRIKEILTPHELQKTCLTNSYENSGFLRHCEY